MKKKKWQRIPALLLALVLGISLLCGCAAKVPDSDITFADQDNPNQSGFHLDGTTLLDAKGNAFVMRGINEPHNWYRDQDVTSFKAISETGSNTIRIVLGCGIKYTKDDAKMLTHLISLAESYNMIPILEVHDVTGSDSIDDLTKVAEYWIEVADVLKGTEDKVIVNIANEWCGSWNANTWKDGYTKVIPMLREAGIKNMILVDAAGWAQFPKSITQYGRQVLACDELHNTIFAVHMYGTLGGKQSSIKSALDDIQNQGLCVIVGEFGYTHSDGDVDEEYIMQYCTEKQIGYLGWSWKGNSGGVEYLDIANTWDGSKLSPDWGENLVNGENGIKKTSKICTVFE